MIALSRNLEDVAEEGTTELAMLAVALRPEPLKDS